jgi:hypothetical protein
MCIGTTTEKRQINWKGLVLNIYSEPTETTISILTDIVIKIGGTHFFCFDTNINIQKIRYLLILSEFSCY